MSTEEFALLQAIGQAIAAAGEALQSYNGPNPGPIAAKPAGFMMQLGGTALAELSGVIVAEGESTGIRQISARSAPT